MQYKNAGEHVLRVVCVAILVLGMLDALAACGPGGIAEIEVRINNISQFDFTDVSVADESFGDIAAGGSSDFVIVTTRFGYCGRQTDGRRPQSHWPNAEYGGKTLHLRDRRRRPLGRPVGDQRRSGKRPFRR